MDQEAHNTCVGEDGAVNDAPVALPTPRRNFMRMVGAGFGVGLLTPLSGCGGSEAATTSTSELGRGVAPDIYVDNWYWGPGNRWAYKHTRRIFPSADIRRGDGPVAKLDRAEQAIDTISFTNPVNGAPMTVAQMYEATDTNAFLVMKRGRIVAERYFGDMQPHDLHLLMSCTKSVMGTLTGIVVANGFLKPEDPVVRYVPEIKGSGYDGATVRQLLDMTVGIDFDEDYASTTSDLYRLDEAAGWVPRGPNAPRGLHEYLPSLVRRAGPNGEVFRYMSPNTDLLGWVLERATNSDFAEIATQLLWSKLGAERDAYVLLDGHQAAYTDPGFNATLRDTGRFAQMVLQNGRYNGQTIVPESWIADFYTGGSQSAWKASPGYRYNKNRYGYADGSYRSGWYVADSSVRFLTAIGLAGQLIVIDPKTETIIVKFSADASPTDFWKDSVSNVAAVAIIQALT